MAWGSNTNPVEIGEATKKVHYDDLWDKLQYIRTDVIPAASIMIFGQITVQGWTRKADWQDDCALIYSASGSLASGGSAAASTHTHTITDHIHQWYKKVSNTTHQSYNSSGTEQNLSFAGDSGGDIGISGGQDDSFAILDADQYTDQIYGGAPASGASTAYYQEVAAFTKDTYT